MPVGFRKLGSPVGSQVSRAADGSCGAHITLGAEGIRYRQRGGGSLGRSLSVTEEADWLPALSADSALQQLNAVSRSRHAWKVAAGGGALALVSLPIHLLLCLLWLCLTLVVFFRVKKADQEQCLFSLEYRMEADAQERWKLLNHALAALARAEKTWHITTRPRSAGLTGHVAASSFVGRREAGVQRRPSRTLPSNVTPYCLHTGGRQLYFFPDRLYVQQNGMYGAHDYADLRLEHGLVRFLEEQEVPQDAQIVGKQWRHMNYAGNSSIPIAQYGTLTLTSLSGLTMLLHVSSVGAAEQFAGLFQSFQQYGKPQPPRDDTPSSSSHSPEECCRRLGLPASCTKGEATAKYRQLVMFSHPDRLGDHTPEAQETATVQLQEIIHTFKELKRLRGW